MAADIPGNRDMYLMQNLKVLNAIGNAANKWTTELYDVLEVKHQIGGTVPHKTAQFTTNISRKAYADSLEQFHSAFSVQSWQGKDSAKVLRPWRYPYFYRKHVSDNIQSSYLRVMVEVAGVEPASESTLTGLSPGADDDCGGPYPSCSPRRRHTVTPSIQVSF